MSKGQFESYQAENDNSYLPSNFLMTLDEREEELRKRVVSEFARVVDLHDRLMDGTLKRRLLVARRWLQDIDHEILGVLLPQSTSQTASGSWLYLAEGLLSSAEAIRENVEILSILSAPKHA